MAIPSRRLRADLALLLTSFLWGTAFVAQRVAAIQLDIFLFTGLRFLLGALILFPFILSRRTGINKQILLGSALAGLLLFTGTTLQQLGLRYTTAGNAGFITGLYVVLVPIFLAVGWKHWPRPTIWLASLLAVMGLFLLSTNGRLSLGLGDSIILIGTIFWAFHVIAIGWLALRLDILLLSLGQCIVCGLLGLIVTLIYSRLSFQGMPEAGWTILYTAFFPIALGYTLQMLGQKEAPPADAAIILSMEAVFAAMSGWFFLGEGLSATQLAGCGLILTGMLLAQLRGYNQPL